MARKVVTRLALKIEESTPAPWEVCLYLPRCRGGILLELRASGKLQRVAMMLCWVV